MKRIVPLLMIALVCALIGSATAQDSGDLADTLASADTPIILGSQIVADTFDTTAAEWEDFKSDAADFRPTDGEYRMEIFQDVSGWGLSTYTHQDAVIQAEMEQISPEENNEYGVMCRARITGTGDGYYFYISGDGYYGIFMYADDTWTPLVDWGYSLAINKGQAANTLTAVCVGDYLALLVNGRLLASATDGTYDEGVAGLTAGAFEGVYVDVRVHSLTIWNASAGESGSVVARPTLPPPPTAAPTETPESGPPRHLDNYDGDWQDAIAELQADGVIATGGSLVFNENRAFFSGQGRWFTPLARRSPFSDIVMAGTLDFSVGNPNELEQCALLSRIGTDSQGRATTYFSAGFLNSGEVLVLDRFDTSQDSNLDYWDLHLDYSTTHHLLYVLQGSTLALYVDGWLISSDFEVHDRSGTYGISLDGAGPGARCEGTNIWVYQAPVFTPGVCTVNAGRTVNKRRQPSTSAATAGQLQSGTSTHAVGQTTGSDGFVWWQLEDGAWVRDDVVNVAGDCASLPDTGGG